MSEKSDDSSGKEDSGKEAEEDLQNFPSMEEVTITRPLKGISSQLSQYISKAALDEIFDCYPNYVPDQKLDSWIKMSKKAREVDKFLRDGINRVALSLGPLVAMARETEEKEAVDPRFSHMSLGIAQAIHSLTYGRRVLALKSTWGDTAEKDIKDLITEAETTGKLETNSRLLFSKHFNKTVKAAQRPKNPAYTVYYSNRSSSSRSRYQPYGGRRFVFKYPSNLDRGEA